MIRPTRTPRVLLAVLATALLACGLGLAAALSGPQAADPAVATPDRAAIQPDASGCATPPEAAVCEERPVSGCEAAAGRPGPAPSEKRPPQNGWCRCSCGAVRCATSADCGGLPCDTTFITCC